MPGMEMLTRIGLHSTYGKIAFGQEEASPIEGKSGVDNSYRADFIHIFIYGIIFSLCNTTTKTGGYHA